MSRKQKRSYPPVNAITSASFGLNSSGQIFQLDGIRSPAVTVKSALSVPAVLNAVTALSKTIASLPIDVYSGDHETDETHPVYKLFNEAPNELQTPEAYRATMVIDMLTTGASVSEIIRDGRGTPTALERIDPRRFTVTLDGSPLRWTYRVDGQEIDPTDLLYCLYFTLDGYTPVSPLTLCRDSIALALAVERFGVSFFQNGARPGGILTTPPGLKPEDKASAKSNWEAAHGGSDNANRVAVMPNGFSFEVVQTNPNEGQFNETREAQIKQIQRILNVPAFIVKDEKTDIYSNRLDVAEDYVRHTLRPIAEVIEQAVEKRMLGDGWECEHDFEELLRGTNTNQAQYVNALVGGGVLTPNEGRELLRRPPIEGGDELVKKAVGQGTNYQHEQNQTSASADHDNGSVAG